MKEKAPRRARHASKSATESPAIDVPCAPADACRDAQPEEDRIVARVLDAILPRIERLEAAAAKVANTPAYVDELYTCFNSVNRDLLVWFDRIERMDREGKALNASFAAIKRDLTGHSLSLSQITAIITCQTADLRHLLTSVEFLRGKKVSQGGAGRRPADPIRVTVIDGGGAGPAPADVRPLLAALPPHPSA